MLMYVSCWLSINFDCEKKIYPGFFLCSLRLTYKWTLNGECGSDEKNIKWTNKEKIKFYQKKFSSTFFFVVVVYVFKIFLIQARIQSKFNFCLFTCGHFLLFLIRLDIFFFSCCSQNFFFGCLLTFFSQFVSVNKGEKHRKYEPGKEWWIIYFHIAFIHQKKNFFTLLFNTKKIFQWKNTNRMECWLIWINSDESEILDAHFWS